MLPTQEDKRQPYEEDIQVPLIVRGPNVAPNSHTSSIALSIDLVGTLMPGYAFCYFLYSVCGFYS